MDATETDGRIELSLSKQEALVFFDWLVRLNSAEIDEILLNKAEKHLLFEFESCLESILIEPFDENYEELIRNARKNISPES